MAERELETVERLAGRVDGFEVRIGARAADGGRLYGGVGKAEIARGLQVSGFAVEEAWVVLEEPIKELGEYPVHLDLPHGLEAEVTVIVEAEE